MRKIFLTVMVAVMMLMSVNFAVANCSSGNCGDQNVNIGIKNTVDTSVTATGGNATQKQGQGQKQKQGQKQTQEAVSNSGGNVYEDAKNFVTASPLQNFVAPVTPSTPMGWKQLGCDFIVAEFTIGQLKKMAEGASFMKKRGTFWYSVLTDDVEYSILNGKETRLNDSTIVRIMVKAPARVNANVYLGEAEGVGRYGAPMGQIIGATVLGLVQKTGATQIALYWDYLVEPVAMSNTLGIGAVGSATERNAGSVAIGAASSTTYNLTSIAYRVKAQAFTGMGESFFSCEEPKKEQVVVVPVVEPEPQPEPQAKCDPSSIWDRINDLNQRVKECLRWCLNNLRLRSKLGEAYIDLYQCTGEKKYLAMATEQFRIAERNHLKGHDIKANQAEANRLIAQDYYFWAGCINVLYGQDAANQFATEKRVEKIPQF